MDVVHEGWLVKSPPGWKGGSTFKLFKSKWRRRYFVLFVPPASINCRSVGGANGLGLIRVDSGTSFGPQLCYYDNEKLDNQHGKIDLRRCETLMTGNDCASVRCDSPFLFALRMRTGSVSRATGKESGLGKAVGSSRTYYMSADSEESLDKWIKCLKDTLVKYGIWDVDTGLLQCTEKPVGQPSAPIKITNTKLHHSETFQQPRSCQFNLPQSKPRLSIFSSPQQGSLLSASKSSRMNVSRHHSKSAADLLSVDCIGEGQQLQLQQSATEHGRSKSPNPSPRDQSTSINASLTIKRVNRFRSSLLSLLVSNQSSSSASSDVRHRHQQQQQQEDEEEEDDDSRRTSPTLSEADIIDDNERRRDEEFASKNVSIRRRPSDLSAEIGRMFKPIAGTSQGPPLPARTNVGLRTPCLFPGLGPEILSTPATPLVGANVGRRLPPLPAECRNAFSPWNQRPLSNLSVGTEEFASKSSISDISQHSGEYDSDYEQPPAMSRPLSLRRASEQSKRLSEESFDLPLDIDDPQAEQRRVIRVGDDVIYDIPRRLFSSVITGSDVEERILHGEDTNPGDYPLSCTGTGTQDDDLYDYLIQESSSKTEGNVACDIFEPEAVISGPPFQTKTMTTTKENDANSANSFGYDDDDQYDYPPFMLAADVTQGTEVETESASHVIQTENRAGDEIPADFSTDDDDGLYDYPASLVSASRVDESTIDSSGLGTTGEEIESRIDDALQVTMNSRDDDDVIAIETMSDDFVKQATTSTSVTHSTVGKETGCHDDGFSLRTTTIALAEVADDERRMNVDNRNAYTEAPTVWKSDNGVTSSTLMAGPQSNRMESLTPGGNMTGSNANTLPLCVLTESADVTFENADEVAPPRGLPLSPESRSIIDSVECNQQIHRRGALQSECGLEGILSSHDLTCYPIYRHHSACSSIGRNRPPVPSKPLKRQAINGSGESSVNDQVVGSGRQVVRSRTIRESVAALGSRPVLNRSDLQFRSVAGGGSVTNQRQELLAELEQLLKIGRVSQCNNET